MEKTYVTEAIILKVDDFREVDRSFTLFTRSRGKISVVARGTKKILSKLNAHTTPLFYTRVMVAKGRQIDKLAGSTVMDHFPALFAEKNNIGFALGSFIAEVTDCLTAPEDHDEEVFALLLSVLQYINEYCGEGDLERARFFADAYVLKLLDLAGYRPDVRINNETHDGTIIPKRLYSLSDNRLVSEVREEETHLAISEAGIVILNHILKTPLSELISVKMNAAGYRELHDVLSSLLLYQLEKKLPTLHFLESIEA